LFYNYHIASLTSSPGGSLPVPSTIFYQDVPSPSPSSEPESESEDSPTQLETTGVVDTLTCPSSMNIENNNNNNKRKASMLNTVVTNRSAPAMRVIGYHMYLPLEVLSYLTPVQRNEFKLLRENILIKYDGSPCRNCNRISCKDKINIRHVMGVAKLTGFIRPNSVYDGSWNEVFNSKDFRLQMHQFYCLFLGLRMSKTPPSNCLEKDLVALFPSPKDLPDNHHLLQMKRLPSKWLLDFHSRNMSKHLYLVEAKKLESVTEAEMEACMNAKI